MKFIKLPKSQSPIKLWAGALDLSTLVLATTMTMASLGVALLMIFGARDGWSELWFTPDQLGQQYFRQGQYIEAARSYRDSMWQGVAWYRAGEFDKAAQAFGNLDTASAQFNAGNACLMQGKYQQAIAYYDLALAKQSNWIEALENRRLAEARAQLLEQTSGDLGEQEMGADKIVFDKNAKQEGVETEVVENQPMSDAAIQALWLRKVQTRPADFLRAKFAYQQALKLERGE
jgi:Ca-activated chloride channel homolog